MELCEKLEEIKDQEYPLLITEEQGRAMGEALDIVMKSVPEDSRADIAPIYSGLFAALCHPEEQC